MRRSIGGALALGLLTAAGCASAPATGTGDATAPRAESDWRTRYPARWWEPAPEEDKPWWEVLPQEAGPGEVILSKRNELGILSNFAPTPFEYRGVRYASLEGFWQCMKYPEGPDDPRAAPGTTWALTRAQVRDLTAFEAHAAGEAAEEQMRALGIEWVSFEGERIAYKDGGPGVERHYALVVAATRAKLEQNPEVRRVLLATGDLVLRPDHVQDADATKAWRYYQIWMDLRSELQTPR